MFWSRNDFFKITLSYLEASFYQAFFTWQRIILIIKPFLPEYVKHTLLDRVHCICALFAISAGLFSIFLLFDLHIF